MLEKTKQLIWSDQYVDLNALTPAASQVTETVLYQSEDASFKLATGLKPIKRIASIHQWNNCFDIYMFIFIKKYPTMAIQLLKYANMNRNMSAKIGFESMRFYDEKFRKLRATHALNWSVMHDDAQLRACRFAASLLRDQEANSPFGGTASRSSPRATAGVFVALVSARTGCVSSATFVASAKNVTYLELAANPLKLPTPIRSGVLGKNLDGYDHLEKEFIINGFNNGFSLGSVNVNYSQNIPRNHKHF